MKFTQTLMNTTLKKTRKILVVFDGMIADMVSNKTLHKLLLNCLFVEEIFHLLLSQAHIFQY